MRRGHSTMEASHFSNESAPQTGESSKQLLQKEISSKSEHVEVADEIREQETDTSTQNLHDYRSEFISLNPATVLLLFCSINMLNYLDRGMIGSNGVNGSRDCDPSAQVSPAMPCTPSGIQGDFALSNFQDGMLPTAFMVGLLAASPLFAHASKTHSPALLMAIGLTVWCISVLGCALSWGLLPLLFWRMLVGVGEASFISLAAPCISDCAPEGKISLWIACFYLCIPVGFALGFIYGGLVATAAGWRVAFAIEAVAMIPFVLFLFVLFLRYKRASSNKATTEGSNLLGDPSLHVVGSAGADNTTQTQLSPPSLTHPKEIQNPSILSGPESHQSQQSSLSEDILLLLRNPIYVRNILGYSAYTFVLGAYAFWAPKAMKALYQFDKADTVFGAITVLTGVGGTLAGGLALDHLGSSLPTAFRLMGLTTLLGGFFCLLSFLSHSLSSFIVLISIGELFLFAIQSPANIVAMQSVPPVLRSLAMAFSTVAVHVLGDVPSPPLLGAIQDLCGDFRVSMGLFTAVFLPAAALWYSGSWLCEAL